MLKSVKFYIFIFFLSIYILLSKGFITELDGNTQYFLSKNIVENKTFGMSLSNDYILSEEKGTISLSNNYILLGKIGKNKKFYSQYTLGQPIISIPLYYMGTLFHQVFNKLPKDIVTRTFVSFLNQIVISFACLTFFCLCSEFSFSIKLSFILTCIFGFGTFCLPYAKSFFSEPLVLLFVLFGTYFIILFKSKRTLLYLLFSAISFCIGILVRPETIIFIPVVILYLVFILKGEKTIGFILFFFLISVLPSCGIIFFYNFYRFGNIFDFGRHLSFSCFILKGLYISLLSPGKSIFLYIPITLFFFPGIKYFYRKFAMETILFTLFIIEHILFYSICKDGIDLVGGYCWGPRHLVPIIPYIILPIGSYLQIIKSKIKFIIIESIIILSFLIQILAILAPYQRFYTDIEKDINIPLETNCFNIKYSPFFGQFVSVFNSKIEKTPFTLNNIDINKEEIQQEISRSFDFWFIYLYRLNFPISIILSSLFLIIITIIVMYYKLSKIIFK